MMTSPLARGVSIMRGVVYVLMTGAVISIWLRWMWLNSEKNIRSPDETPAPLERATALRYAGYFFTSMAPGRVASGNPTASGASPSAGFGRTLDAAGREWPAR